MRRFRAAEGRASWIEILSDTLINERGGSVVVLIPCPYCGPRNASEFAYRGESRRRPEVASAEPAEWRDYLYAHTNPAGWVLEGWYHRAGCRKFIKIERHTVSNEVRWSGPAQASPAPSEEGGGQ